MRIAFVVEEFPCLSETFILNQITGLIDRGHEVEIYAERQKTYPKIHPIIQDYKLLERTFYFGRKPDFKPVHLLQTFLRTCFSKPGALLSSIRFLKSPYRFLSLDSFLAVASLNPKPYDVIHCHFGLNGLKGSLLREFDAIQGKLAVTFHGVDIADSVQSSLGKDIFKAYKELSHKSNLFLPISDRWKNRLVEIGCDKEKILVHRMGIDCSKFSFVPRSVSKGEKIKILTIARLVEKKGVEYGIRAVARSLETHPEIEYNIVGDGTLKESLQQLICDLDVEDSIKLLGWKQQSEVIELLNDAHLFLAPSVTSQQGDQEGIPVVLMEAMAMGLPVVSTDHSGIPELVENNVSGFLVPERDVAALTEKIQYLAEHPEQWAVMGKAGQTYVEKYYNIDKLNHQLIEIFHDLTHEPGKLQPNCYLSSTV